MLVTYTFLISWLGQRTSDPTTLASSKDALYGPSLLPFDTSHCSIIFWAKSGNPSTRYRIRQLSRLYGTDWGGDSGLKGSRGGIFWSLGGGSDSGEGGSMLPLGGGGTRLQADTPLQTATSDMILGGPALFWHFATPLFAITWWRKQKSICRGRDCGDGVSRREKELGIGYDEEVLSFLHRASKNSTLPMASTSMERRSSSSYASPTPGIPVPRLPPDLATLAATYRPRRGG